MVIGIISDTHRNRDLHSKVYEILTKNKMAEKIYHLGDDYIDGELEIEKGIDSIIIPGIYCPEYKNNTVPKIAFDTIQGINIVMAHDITDISEQDMICNDIILYGHTHKAQIDFSNGKLKLNPGHLKSTKDKGREPSFAILTIDYGQVKAYIEDLKGKTIDSISLAKAESGLYKK